MRLVEEILLISHLISLKYMITRRQIYTHPGTHSHCLILPTKPALWVEPMPGYVPYRNNWFCCTSKQHCFWELAFINWQNGQLAIYSIFSLTQYFSVSPIYVVDVLMVYGIMGYLLWLPILNIVPGQPCYVIPRRVRKEIIIICRKLHSYAILCASCLHQM